MGDPVPNIVFQGVTRFSVRRSSGGFFENLYKLQRIHNSIQIFKDSIRGNVTAAAEAGKTCRQEGAQLYIYNLHL